MNLQHLLCLTMFIAPPSLQEYGMIDIHREFIKNPNTNEDIGEMILEFNNSHIDFMMIKFGEYALVDFTFEGERVKYVSYKVKNLMESRKADRFVRNSL